MKKLLLLPFCLMLLGTSNLLAQTDWHLGGNTLSSSQRLGTNNSYSLIFETNNSDRGRITSGGNWGIGTTDPTAKLHVNSTVSGQIPFRIQTLGTTRFLVNSAGDVGIGTSSPLRKLQVQNGSIRISRDQDAASYFEFVSTYASQYDMRMEHSGSSLWFTASQDNFTNFTDMARFNLYPNPDYVFEVYGNALATGIWQNSDRKLKKDIQDFGSALQVVNQLRPKTYFFKTDEYSKLNLPSSKQYGFIAQEVEKVLPELVMTSQQPGKAKANGERQMEEVKAINYTAFIPILTQAIQDQQQTIQQQQQMIQLQQQTISTLTNRMAKLEAASSMGHNLLHPGNQELAGISLEQNQPNPVYANTTFRYTIPNHAHAQILVYQAATGKLVKTLEAPVSGRVEMNTMDLEAGTYIYTLVVNGQQAAAKQLLLSK